MSSASAMAGSSIVTIRPTMTRSPPSEPVAPAVVVGAGASSAEHDGDVGELVPAKAQPVTRASTISAADNEPNPLRDASMLHLLQGWSAAVGPLVNPSSAEPGPLLTESVAGARFVQSPLRRESGRPSRPPAHRSGSGQLEGG